MRRFSHNSSLRLEANTSRPSPAALLARGGLALGLAMLSLAALAPAANAGVVFSSFSYSSGWGGDNLSLSFNSFSPYHRHGGWGYNSWHSSRWYDDCYRPAWYGYHVVTPRIYDPYISDYEWVYDGESYRYRRVYHRRADDIIIAPYSTVTQIDRDADGDTDVIIVNTPTVIYQPQTIISYSSYRPYSWHSPRWSNWYDSCSPRPRYSSITLFDDDCDSFSSSFFVSISVGFGHRNWYHPRPYCPPAPIVHRPHPLALQPAPVLAAAPLVLPAVGPVASPVAIAENRPAKSPVPQRVTSPAAGPLASAAAPQPVLRSNPAKGSDLAQRAEVKPSPTARASAPTAIAAAPAIVPAATLNNDRKPSRGVTASDPSQTLTTARGTRPVKIESSAPTPIATKPAVVAPAPIAALDRKPASIKPEATTQPAPLTRGESLVRRNNSKPTTSVEAKPDVTPISTPVAIKPAATTSTPAVGPSVIAPSTSPAASPTRTVVAPRGTEMPSNIKSPNSPAAQPGQPTRMTKPLDTARPTITSPNFDSPRNEKPMRISPTAAQPIDRKPLATSPGITMPSNTRPVVVAPSAPQNTPTDNAPMREVKQRTFAPQQTLSPQATPQQFGPQVQPVAPQVQTRQPRVQQPAGQPQAPRAKADAPRRVDAAPKAQASAPRAAAPAPAPAPRAAAPAPSSENKKK